MRGLGAFQMAPMKHRDAWVFGVRTRGRGRPTLSAPASPRLNGLRVTA